MKKLAIFSSILFLLLLCSCEKEDSSSLDPTTLNPNEFALLFPGYIGFDQLELNDNTSVFFYSDGMDNITLSAIDSKGTILWTKAHPSHANEIVSQISIIPFVSNGNIVAFSTGFGIHRYEFNSDGDLLEARTVSNESGYYLYRNGNELYGVRATDNGDLTDAEFIKLSMDGNIYDSSIFSASRVQYSYHVKVKNDRVYFFGRGFGPNNVDEFFFCEIYSYSGDFIKRIELDVPENSARHTQRIMENGNFIMTIENYLNGETQDFQIHAFDPEGNSIKSFTFDSTDRLQISALPNGHLGVCGKEGNSSNGSKNSQFAVYDTNMNEVYRRNIGSYDGRELFYRAKEYFDSYHIFGNTSGSDGDFDLANNSPVIDLFYLKLEK